jgi:hypothetical protein
MGGQKYMDWASVAAASAIGFGGIYLLAAQYGLLGRPEGYRPSKRAKAMGVFLILISLIQLLFEFVGG